MSETKKEKELKNKATKELMAKWRSEYNMLCGGVGKLGGQEVIVTHRNPETGELWIEPDGIWVDPDKVDFSENPVP